MKEEKRNMIPYMKSLVTCLSRIMKSGYTEIFKAAGKKFFSKTTKKTYGPEDIRALNFFRFEGNSNTNETAIMYIIETNDGLKGTLVETSPRSRFSRFLQEVLIQKGLKK